MGDDQLLAFIQNSRSKGRSDEQIRRALLAVGWKKERVDAALIQAAEPEKGQVSEEKAQQPQNAQLAQTAQPTRQSQPLQQPTAAKTAQLPSSQPMEKPAQTTAQPQTDKPAQSSIPNFIAPPTVKSPPWVSQTIESKPAVPTTLQGQAATQPVPQTQAQPASSQPAAITPLQQQSAAPRQDAPAQKKQIFPFRLPFGKKAPSSQTQTASQPGGAQPTPVEKEPLSPQSGQSAAGQQPSAQAPLQAAQPSSLEQTIRQQQQNQTAQSTEQPQPASQMAQQGSQPQAQNPAFSNVSNSAPPKKTTLAPILIAAVLILLAAGAYYVFVIGANSAPAPLVPQPEVPLPPQIIPQQNSSNNSSQAGQNTTAPPQISAYDCGTDFNCFIQKSPSCSPAKAEFSSTADNFGMATTTTSGLQINGRKGGRCEFYIKNKKIEVHFSDQTIQQMLQSGLTLAQINASEEQANNHAQAGAGLEGTCMFEPSDLTSMLLRWRAGASSASDYGSAACTGTLFSQNQAAGQQGMPILPPSPPPLPQEIPSAQIQAPGQAPPESGQTPPATILTPQEEQPQIFVRFKPFTSSGPYSPSAFCKNEGNGTLTRIHYKLYWGGECTSEKGKDGFVNETGMPSKCELVPCCYYAPFSDYSTLYDYFECGYTSSE